MEEINSIQNEENLYLYNNTRFPKKARDVIWHGSFFDRYTDQQIDSIAVRLYNDCRSKLSLSMFAVKPDDIYKNFWTKEGIGHKILTRTQSVDPTNEECIKFIEEHKKKLVLLQTPDDQHECVVKNCIKYIEAKIGVHASLLLSPKRINELRKSKTENYIRNLGHYIGKGKGHRHNEKADKKKAVLYAYQAQQKTDKEMVRQEKFPIIAFVKSDQNLKPVHDVPQPINEL